MLLLPEPKVKNKLVRVFSFGGGVQSTAALILQAQGKLNYDFFVMSNVGHDSENPATIEYIENITKNYAAKHGIPFVEVQKTTRGKPETLYQYIYRTKRSVPIPMRMSNGAPGNRSCTIDFKIKVIDRWVKDAGFAAGIIGLGISTDESQRRKHEFWHKDGGIYKRREHPLIEMMISRNECHSIIKRAGLPIPPKSACWFCPFTSRGEWIERKKHQPELFAKAVQLEKDINKKRGAMGPDRVYIHPSTGGRMNTLNHAVGDQLSLFEETCDSGYCFV